MTAFLKPLIWLIVGSTLGVLAAYRFAGSGPPTLAIPAPAAPAGVARIRALGALQPRDGIVDVAIPAGLNVVRLGPGVEEGRTVAANALLAILDGYDERSSELEILKAEIAAARDARAIEDDNERRTLAEIDRERRRAIRLGELEQAALACRILALEAKYRLSQQQFDQVEGLQGKGTVALQQYHQLKAQSEISREELNLARAEKARAEEALALNTSDETIEEQRQRVQTAARRARAQSPLDSLEKKMAMTEVMRDRCRILAPRAGRILKLTTQVGEAAVGKPLLRLGDTTRMYVLAEVYGEDRHRVKVGQEARIEGRGLPEKTGGELRGRVRMISGVITPHTLSPIDPTARENARVFEAWIELDLDGSKDADYLEQLRGLCLLPVDVTIQPEGPGGEARGERPRPQP
jgi:HlyD family secretion protein